MVPRLLLVGWHPVILLFISWYPAAEEKEKRGGSTSTDHHRLGLYIAVSQRLVPAAYFREAFGGLIFLCVVGIPTSSSYVFSCSIFRAVVGQGERRDHSGIRSCPICFIYLFLLFFAIRETLTHTWGNMASHCSEYIEEVFPLSGFHRSFSNRSNETTPIFPAEGRSLRKSRAARNGKYKETGRWFKKGGGRAKYI